MAPPEASLRIRVPQAGLFAVVLAAIAFLSLSTLDHAKYPAIEALRQGLGATGALTAAAGALGAADFAAMGVALLAAIAFLLVERRHGAMVSILSDETLGLRLVSWLVAIFLAHSLFHPGLLLGGDSSSHIARIAHFADALRQGDFLWWDNYHYAGNPFLVFTGPLFFWVAGLTGAALNDPTLGTKTVLFVAQLASFAAMYGFARRLGLSPLAAAIGAIGYSAAWAHLHLIYYRGTFPQSFSMVFLPLALWLVDRLLDHRRVFSADWAWLALVTGLMAVNHPTNGLMIGLVMAVFALFRMQRLGWPGDGWRALITAALAGGAVFAVTAAPILAESRWVMMAAGENMHLVWMQLPDWDYVRNLLVWNPGKAGEGPVNAAYLGLSLVLLALVGAFRSFSRGVPRQMPLFLALLVLFFFLRGNHVRDIYFTLFFLCLLAAAGVQVLIGTSARRIWVALIAAIVFVDLLSTGIQPIARRDKAFLVQASDALGEAGSPERVIVVGGASPFTVPIGPGGGVLSYGRVPLLIGAHSMAATTAHNYIAIGLDAVKRDLDETGRLGKPTRDILHLMRVGKVIHAGSSRLGDWDVPALNADDPHLGRHVDLDPPAVVVTQRLDVLDVDYESADKPIIWYEYLEDNLPQVGAAKHIVGRVVSAMGLSADGREADTVLIRPGQVASPPPSRPGAACEPLGGGIDYQVLAFRLDCARAAYLRLPVPFHPDLEISVDGHPVPVLRSALNFSVIAVDAGLHELRVVARPSSLRLAGMAFSGTVAGLLVFLGLVQGLRSLVGRSRRGHPGVAGEMRENSGRSPAGR